MRRFLPLLAACGFAAACEKPVPRVSLADTEPPSASTSTVQALRLAVAPIESPETSFAEYSDLFTRLGHGLGLPVTILQRQTYAEIVSLVENRRVDAALVCSGPYVEAERGFGAQILAVPRIGGSTSYRAYIVVRQGGGLRRLGDLRGRTFALTDPLSTSGRLYPEQLLRRRGESTASFFGKVLYTKGHDNSLQAVAEGLADGAAVSGLVFDGVARARPELTRRLRVIARSEPLGNPPIIVNPALDPGLRRRLRDALLHLHEEPEGRRLLATLGIERFVAGDPRAYDEVRRLRAEARPRATP